MRTTMSKKLLAFILTLAMLIPLIGVSATPASAAGEDSMTFQVIATSDLHGSFYDKSYSTNKPSTGLARVAAEINQLRSGREGGTILIDMGDTIQGNGTTVFLSNSEVKVNGVQKRWSDFSGLYPALAGLDYLGYDAWVLGNHEFNFGMEALESAYGKGKGANGGNLFGAAILAGNLVAEGVTDASYRVSDAKYDPYFVKQVTVDGKTANVAFISMTHDNIINWDKTNLAKAGLTTVTPLAATKAVLAYLKGDYVTKEGNAPIDVFILAHHLDESGATEVLADAGVAADAALFIGAHGHANKPDTIINGVHYIERPDAGKALSHIEITLTQVGGKWTVADKENDVKTRNIALTADSPVDEAFAKQQVMLDADAFGLANCNTVIGALTGGPLVAAPAIKGTYEGYLHDNALTDLINEAMLHYTNAYIEQLTGGQYKKGSVTISATAPLDELANAQVGPLTKGDVATIYKYDNNTLYIVRLTGAEIKKWMEWSYNYYVQLAPGDINVGYGATGHDRGYNCDQFTGFDYIVDLTKPVGSRITVTGYNGTTGAAFDEKAWLEGVYNVAVNNYRASSQLFPADPARSIIAGYDPEVSKIIAQEIDANFTGEGMLGVMIEYIQKVKGGSIDNSYHTNWSLKVPAVEDSWVKALIAADNAGTIKPVVDPTNRYPIARVVNIAELAPVMGDKVIDVYSFNDFHGTVDKSASGSNPGADRFVAVVEEMLGRNPQGSVLLAAGDLYQGSPLSNLFVGEPVSAMLRRLGVEYSALGNHEFDWGQDKIAKFAADGNITFLTANIFLAGTENRPDYCQPTAIVEVGGLKIGLIGLATPLTVSLVKADAVKGLEFRAPETVVPALEKQLRDAGCDAVIALTHLGSAQGADGVITGEAAALAEACGTLDAIISAHTHRLVAGYVNGVPIVQGNYNGRGLGRLTFHVDSKNNILGVYPRYYTQNQMNGTEETLLPKETVDAETTAAIAKFNTQAGPLFAQIVGYYGEPITSKDVQADWATKVVWDFITRETGEEYILVQNAGGWRDTSPYDRKADDAVTMGYLYALMPFDNEIVLLPMKGKDILHMLNLPVGDAGVISAQCVAGAYKGDGGKWYLTGSNAEILADGTYNVACNDFMLTGGDRYPFPGSPQGNAAGVAVLGEAKFMGVPLRDAMVQELLLRAGLDAPIAPNPAAAMVDVAADAWYYDVINQVLLLGLMNGTGDNRFSPEVTLTRSMFITSLYRMAGQPAVTGETTFSDVEADQWYTNAVLWAAENGISVGTGTGAFGVNDEITRESMATFLYRMLGDEGNLPSSSLSGYPGGTDVSDWAVNAMNWAISAQVIQGKPNGLDPQGLSQRAEAAAVLVRAATMGK